MGADQYLAAWNYQKRVNDSVTEQVVELWLQASKDTKEGDDLLPNYNKITRTSEAHQAAEKFTRGMLEFTRLMGADLDPDDPEQAMRLDSMAYGLFGFRQSHIQTFFEQHGKDMNPLELLNYLGRSTAYGHMQSTRFEGARQYISEDDKDEILAKTGVADRVHKERLSEDDLVDIINEFASNDGAMKNSFFQGKHWTQAGSRLILPSTAILGADGTPARS